MHAQQRQKTEDEAESEDDAIEDRFTKVGGGGSVSASKRRRGVVEDSGESDYSSSNDDAFSEEDDGRDSMVNILFAVESFYVGEGM